MMDMFHNVSPEISSRAAPEIGVKGVTGDLSYLENYSAPQPGPKRSSAGSSPALSMENSPRTPKGRKVAVLVADGVKGQDVKAFKAGLKEVDVMCKVVSKRSGMVGTSDGSEIEADENFSTAASVVFDAVYVPGGEGSLNLLMKSGDALHFLNETFRHCKPIVATDEGVDLLKEAQLHGVTLAESGMQQDHGVITARGGEVSDVVGEFTKALAQHRFWERTMKDMVPA